MSSVAVFGAGVCIEGLERRALLSWPAAPFAPAVGDEEIFVNQLGHAVVGPRQLLAGKTHGYSLIFDDGGPLTAQTTGAIATQLAFYNTEGQPLRVAGSGAGTTTTIATTMPADKRTVYLAVQGKTPTTAGSYTLTVDGPREGVIYPLSVKSDSDSGSSGDDISGPGDYDFWRFRTTRAGSWKITLTSKDKFNGSFNVFTGKGEPLAGGFDSPIDRTGVGGTESCILKNLPAGGDFFIRVDGVGSSMGDYGIKAEWAGVPTVSIAASDASASEAGATGQFTVTRSPASANHGKLTVYYAITGTATNGVDYSRLSGSVVIADGHSSASIKLSPLADSVLEGDETAVLTLRASSLYKLGSSRIATVRIADKVPAMAWPRAPYSSTQSNGRIHLNQFGQATLRGTIARPNVDFDGYSFYMARGGGLSAVVTGDSHPQVAYYEGDGTPDLSSALAGQVGDGAVNVVAPAQKMLYLGVGSQGGGTSGAYRLNVTGTRPTIAYVEVPPRSFTGSASGSFDKSLSLAMYSFTVPYTGDWKVTTTPVAGLRASMIVFDSAGTPVGGSFTRAIDSGRTGAAVAWTGRGIQAGKTYCIRVDDQDGKGTYRVGVQRIGMASVGVVAPDSIASKDGKNTGQFLLARSGGNINAPLTVSFSLTGSAVNGTDYQSLRKSVTFAAGKTYSRVYVKPIAQAPTGADKTVNLALRWSSAYQVAAHKAATVTIANDPNLRPWPQAPFNSSNYDGTVYVNQNGKAWFSGKPISPAGDIDGYRFYYDDTGTFATQVIGSVPMDLAYYDKAGQPLVNGTVSGNSSLVVNTVPDDKRMLYVAVRAHSAAASGSYKLKFNGPVAGYIEDIPIKNFAGASGSDISGDNDFDFYKFTTTRAGNWTVQIKPDSNTALDATMNVYDAGGNPVGGTFLSTIDAKGANGIETWTGYDLRAGQTYYVRVDGAASSVGGYGIAVEWTEPAQVSLVGTDLKASRATGDPAVLTVKRVDDGVLLLPLTVNYTIRGTATAGKDYQKLSGSVTIPIGQTSATILVRPIKGSHASVPESIVVSLTTGNGYILASSATETIVLPAF